MERSVIGLREPADPSHQGGARDHDQRNTHHDWPAAAGFLCAPKYFFRSRQPQYRRNESIKAAARLVQPGSGVLPRFPQGLAHRADALVEIVFPHESTGHTASMSRSLSSNSPG